jgi:hypothetical protein
LRIERVGNSSVSDKLRQLSGEVSWSDLFSRSKRFVRVSIRAEEIDFSRAAVFIGDINAKTRGAFDELTVEHLIHLLYADFLRHIRENLSEVKIDADSVTMEDTVRGLIEKRQIYFPRNKLKDPGTYLSTPKRWAFFEIHLRREAAQRGTVFLYDAASVFPNFEMSLEELLSLLLLDFVAQLRKGNQKAMINALLDSFYFHEFD